MTPLNPNDDATPDKPETLGELLARFTLKWGKRDFMPEVLVIDDDPADLILMQRVASQVGWKVHSEHRGLTAIDTYKKQMAGTYWLSGCSPHPFDMVLLDLKLPDIPGTEVFAAIKGLHRGQPIAIVTGYAKEYDLNAMAKVGYAGLVLKPLTLEGLEEILEAHNLPAREPSPPGEAK